MDSFDDRPESAHTKMVAMVGSNKRVLEVGCGRGFVSERLKQNGCSVVGMEIDGGFAREAKRGCEKVIVGNVETMKLELPAKSFDVILLGDVLEHLRDPATALEKLKPLLHDNGAIVVSLPNIANWKVRLKLLFGKFEYEDWGILDRTHLHFFTRKTARGLLKKTGFRILEEDFVPSFPLPFFKRQLARINPNAFAYQFLFRVGKAIE